MYTRPRISGPETIEEWVNYISDEIPSNQLIHQARVLGSSKFMSVLRQEGFEGKDLDAIHLAVVRRFLIEDVRIHQNMENCSINYFELSEQIVFEKELKKK